MKAILAILTLSAISFAANAVSYPVHIPTLQCSLEDRSKQPDPTLKGLEIANKTQSAFDSDYISINLAAPTEPNDGPTAVIRGIYKHGVYQAGIHFENTQGDILLSETIVLNPDQSVIIDVGQLVKSSNYLRLSCVFRD